jgi:hypothetical protein
MLSTDDRRRILFWRPDSSSVTGMLRVTEREDRLNTTYSEHFLVVVVYEGAFDGWYRGRVHTHVAGAIKLKEPGEVHRDVRVHTPFTLQGAGFSPEMVAGAAAALGLRGPVHFKAPGFGERERATRLALAMHSALIRPDVPEIERATRVAETLGEILGDDSRSDATHVGGRAPRSVRLIIRYERKGANYLALLHLASGLIAFQQARRRWARMAGWSPSLRGAGADGHRRPDGRDSEGRTGADGHGWPDGRHRCGGARADGHGWPDGRDSTWIPRRHGRQRTYAR